MEIVVSVDENVVASQIKVNFKRSSFGRSLELFKEQAKELSDKNKMRYPSQLLDSKIIAHEFSSSLGIKVPEIYQIDCSIDEVDFKPNTVVKPLSANSAKGVFICNNKNIKYLNTGESFKNSIDAKKYAKKLLTKNILKHNRWMVEELIHNNGEIARDVKFYCFYGEIGLVLESQRIPELKRCWFDSDLNIVKTGKYDNNGFIGDSSTLLDMFKLAEKISLEVPSAFVRIDFLQRENDIIFGEFTPFPWGFERFNSDWDEKLGDLYQNAATRLIYDVANGKVFNNYINLDKSIKGNIEKIKHRLEN